MKKAKKLLFWALALLLTAGLISGIMAEEMTAPAEKPAEELFFEGQPLEKVYDDDKLVSIKVYTAEGSNGEIYYGDVITFQAIVKGIEGPYTVIWEMNTPEDGWVELFVGEEYTFVVTQYTAAQEYRARVVFK